MFNKLVLLAIALGLWANALAAWTHPAKADAASSLNAADSLVSYVSVIAHDVHALANGGSGCSNRKICD